MKMGTKNSMRKSCICTRAARKSLEQVQSYNLNREHYRRKVTLEIRNKKGKLSYLGFLEQERIRNNKKIVKELGTKLRT